MTMAHSKGAHPRKEARVTSYTAAVQGLIESDITNMI